MIENDNSYYAIFENKTSGKKLTREQTAALNKRLAKKKEKIHEKVGSSGKGRTLDFTPEGEKLWEKDF